jgi:predicted transposase YbfD/YdcC
MDQQQYSTLLAAVAEVPDPRAARGKQHSWTLIVTIICAALASGQQSGRAIGQWAREHALELLSALQPVRGRLPSEATLRRALRQLDVTALEARIVAFGAQATSPHAGCILSPQGEVLQAQAIDGKTVCGASAHGEKLHLVSLVAHDTAHLLAQTAVATKSSEQRVAPKLLRGRTGPGTVTTMDALLTQRKLAAQIVAAGGYYLMIVKRNQRQLYDDLALFFQIPPIAADNEQWDSVTTFEKQHGRLEQRTLECSTGLCDYLSWPGAAQVLRRTCERQVISTGKYSCEVSYGLTNLTPREAQAPELEALWRGHWTIENRGHYVRDVSLGEDAHQAHCGQTAVPWPFCEAA